MAHRESNGCVQITHWYRWILICDVRGGASEYPGESTYKRRSWLTAYMQCTACTIQYDLCQTVIVMRTAVTCNLDSINVDSSNTTGKLTLTVGKILRQLISSPIPSGQTIQC
jgi:hypothetical protein